MTRIVKKLLTVLNSDVLVDEVATTLRFRYLDYKNMKRIKPKLTLDRPVTYQIKIPGALDALWLDDANVLSITIEENKEGQPISIITSTMDQATLQGHLRQLYGMGLPLISVVWVDEL